MKKKIQNKLGTYLAVTAGVGCAASVAEGQILVENLSGLNTVSTSITLPGGDGGVDLRRFESLDYGYFTAAGTAFYRNNMGVGRFASGVTVAFPENAYGVMTWFESGNAVAGFTAGVLNWVPFRDTANRYGWMSFTLASVAPNSPNPVASFGHFVYDPASTSAGTAITLQAAEAAVAAVPEPSSLVLFTLGATGIAARRQRKKAA